MDLVSTPLNESSLPPTPLHLTLRWLQDALQRYETHGDVVEPSALYLATADSSGQPNLRVVLMRFLDEFGPGWVSDTRSIKARDIAENPKVCASLVWMPLSRQIHFTGTATRVSREKAQDYWDTRPYGAKITSWSQEQSDVAESREAVEARFTEMTAKYPADQPVPMPDHFAGWQITCDKVEFFSGRDHRLHDRLVFTNPGGLTLGAPGWKVTRLQP